MKMRVNWRQIAFFKFFSKKFEKTLDKNTGMCYNNKVAERGIAQLVEQRSPKPRVTSSILVAPAIH